MIWQTKISIPPQSAGWHLITPLIIRSIPAVPEFGLLNLFIQHTSASLAISENASPDVRTDLFKIFEELVPQNLPYEHTEEGPDDMPAHGKNILAGSTLTVPIRDHAIALGTWQGIYLAEFRDKAPSRSVIITVYS